MSMRRDTEFRWQGTSRSRSKLTMSLLLGGVGLATGYTFVHVGQGDDSSPASTLETARTPDSPLMKHAIDEPSAVASAAPLPVQLLNPHSASALAEPAINESSAVATAAPPSARLLNPAAQASVEQEQPSVEREQQASTKSVTKGRPPTNYTTLRQALLKNIR